MKEEIQTLLKEGFQAQMNFYEKIEKDFNKLDQSG